MIDCDIGASKDGTSQDCVGDFGNKFRQARESKDLSLDDVSNVTKISSRMLKAIEEERFDQLPGGVFNKGFIRAYSKHLGLDPEAAVADYLLCLRQAQIDAHEVWEPVRVPDAPHTSRERPQPYNKPSLTALPPVEIDEELPELQLPRAEDARPPRRDYPAGRIGEIPWAMLAVAAILLVAGGYLWTHHSRIDHDAAAESHGPSATLPAELPKSGQTTSVSSNSTQTQTTQAPAKPATEASGSGTAPASTSTQPAPSSSVAQTSTQPITRPEPNKPEPRQAAKAAATPDASTNPAPTVSVQRKGDVIIRTFGAPVAKSSEKTSGSLSLIIRATENSWVSVLADGQVVTHETLIAPANSSVHATREIQVRIGNAAGVTFEWNGEEIPAQGAEGEVKTFLFDSSGLHVIPNQPPVQNH